MLIKRLNLNYFRNHKNFTASSDAKFVIICGPNGAGKTNILEALSLFSPGKGMRNAGSDKIFSNNHPAGEWAVSCLLMQNDDEVMLTTGCSRDGNQTVSRRIVKVNDEVSDKSSELLHYLKVLWLTPQTDRIFLESPAVRRKFLDRVTYNFFPLHAMDIINYEKLVKSRLKIIQSYSYDKLWVSILEKQLADLNYKIYNSRKECLNLIKQALAESSNDFLKPNIGLIGPVESLSFHNQEDAIPYIQQKLEQNRKIDSISGRTNFGIHKSDIEAFHPIKNIQADQCSTGEQKAMLLSIILAQIKAIKKISSVPIILLLDEAFAHLDKNFRFNLIEELAATEAQVWITTANGQIIEEIDYPKSIIRL